MLGKQCSCGQWHDTQGTLADNTPSMFARRGFWIAGAVSFALLWSAVAFLK
jgi:hypothetical protein